MENLINSKNKKVKQVILYEKRGNSVLARKLELNTDYRRQCLDSTSPLYYVVIRGLWGKNRKDKTDNPYLPIKGTLWKGEKPFLDLIDKKDNCIMSSDYSSIRTFADSKGLDPYLKICHQANPNIYDEVVRAFYPTGFEEVQKQALEDLINGNANACPHIIQGYSDNGYNPNASTCFTPTSKYVSPIVQDDYCTELMPGLIKIPEGAFYRSQLLNVGRLIRLAKNTKNEKAWSKLAEHYRYVGTEEINMTILPENEIYRIERLIRNGIPVVQSLSKSFNKYK